MLHDQSYYDMYTWLNDSIDDQIEFEQRKDALETLNQGLVNRAAALLEAKKISVRYYGEIFTSLVNLVSNQNWRAEIKKIEARIAKREA